MYVVWRGKIHHDSIPMMATMVINPTIAVVDNLPRFQDAINSIPMTRIDRKHKPTENHTIEPIKAGTSVARSAHDNKMKVS